MDRKMTVPAETSVIFLYPSCCANDISQKREGFGEVGDSLEFTVEAEGDELLNNQLVISSLLCITSDG